MEKRIIFENREKFRQWLEENHDSHDAVWLVIGKKGGLQTLSADEALWEALCFGWIDGLIKSVDDTCYIKRFSHRVKNSQWSKRNIDFVKKLVADGLMTKHGMDEIEKAKKNGRWIVRERVQVTTEQIDAFIEAINGVQPALSNYLNMSESVKRIYAIHYLSAKRDDTKKRRLEKIIERLNQNLKPM